MVRFSKIGSASMDLVKTFNSVRDIPYRIPLKSGDRDDCCSGKAARLFELLTKNGYDVRYRICLFFWNSIILPKSLEKIPHENDCTHTYLEIIINGKWKVIDPTWDKGLGKILPINKWDGKANTEIAVKPVKIFSPKKSAEIVNNQTQVVIEKDLKINGKFYKAFNEWLQKNRVK